MAARGCPAVTERHSQPQQSVRKRAETIPAADLKKKLIDLCQTRSKPYGIMVAQNGFPVPQAPPMKRAA